MGYLLYIFLFLYKLLYFLELLILKCSTWMRRFSKYSPDGTSRLKVGVWGVWGACLVFFFNTVINLCAKLPFQASEGVMFSHFSGSSANNCPQSLVARASSFGSDLALLHSISDFCELLGSPMSTELLFVGSQRKSASARTRRLFHTSWGRKSHMEISLSQYRSPPHKLFSSCSQGDTKQKPSTPHAVPVLAAAAVLSVYSIWAQGRLDLQGPGTTQQSWKTNLAVAGWKSTRYFLRLLQPVV